MHKHLASRGTFVEVDGLVQAAPAPRFDRTTVGAVASIPATSSPVSLTAWGIDETRIADLTQRSILS